MIVILVFGSPINSSLLLDREVGTLPCEGLVSYFEELEEFSAGILNAKVDVSGVSTYIFHYRAHFISGYLASRYFSSEKCFSRIL